MDQDQDHEIAIVRIAAERQGPTRIARLVGVGESTVRAWLTGRGRPRKRVREAIRAAFTEDGQPREQPAAPAPPGATPAANADHDDPKANAIATLAVLRRHLATAGPDEVTPIANAITSSSRLLARLSGQLEVTQSQVLRSPAWQRLQRAILDALAPFPEALRAVADAAERLDDA